jgi:hypothetical protein
MSGVTHLANAALLQANPQRAARLFFDDARVHIELPAAQVTVMVPGEVTVYLRAFDRLAPRR